MHRRRPTLRLFDRTPLHACARNLEGFQQIPILPGPHHEYFRLVLGNRHLLRMLHHQLLAARQVNRVKNTNYKN